jgi:hypothetical protein
MLDWMVIKQPLGAERAETQLERSLVGVRENPLSAENRPRI